MRLPRALLIWKNANEPYGHPGKAARNSLAGLAAGSLASFAERLRELLLIARWLICLPGEQPNV